SRNVVEREQHLDFFRNRSFRLTLACHASAKLDRELSPDRVRELHAGLDIGVEEISMSSKAPSAPITVRTKSTQMQVEDPLMKAALVALGTGWPGSTPFGELASALGAKGLEPALAGKLLELFRLGFVWLSVRPPTFATTPPARPRACALARVQAE